LIPLDFDYYRPESVAEAVSTFRQLTGAGRDPVYYGGGTEILTLARTAPDQLRCGAVIDLKAVPECRVLERDGDRALVGAAATLAEVCEAGLWPLLEAAAGRVADHTTRRQVTLGGNLAGRIRYREAALAPMLADCCAVVAGEGGLRRRPFSAVFDGRLHLEPPEFLAQIEVDRAEADLPCCCIKQTRLDWIDYPLLTVAAVRRDGGVALAFSGLCADPFRSRAVDEALNGGAPGRGGRVPSPEAVERALEHLPGPVMDDIHGSAAYRRFVLGYTLEEIWDSLGG
jgi:CO/xanthine dehydrogenase FAD-binding subunit